MTELGGRLRDLVTGDDAKESLRTYFAEPEEAGNGVFSGRNFERLGGGGDQASNADRMTADDLLAVEMLSVSVPAEVSYQILHGALGDRLSALLSRIPTDVSLGDPEAAEHLQDDAAASTAWSLLEDQHDVGWVTAGKLMARKRPKLIPVYDNVVRCALKVPKPLWLSLHSELLPEHELRSSIRTVRLSAGVPDYVSDLRVLDVIVWMQHRVAHRQGACG